MLPFEEIDVTVEISGAQHTANNRGDTKHNYSTTILYPTVDYHDNWIEIITTNTYVTSKITKKADMPAFFFLYLVTRHITNGMCRDDSGTWQV